ncbi:hypothetical protein [Deinococcus yavapaiensis]|uniref:Uncharacterized protein n=1 Tax=Deinococcus yavapaiensis KR-236 TaxID=694435 RepID=A0A318SCZ2_9DEIO|nr:hypothetical protein [Deinococcus yavapaiensis]PYE56523.1 hypothetical protein DES52_101327 [Deinococcus yavapaiensis KR-236]
MDVRGLGSFERAQTSFVLDDRGNQVWPDAELVKNVSSGLWDEGRISQQYVRDESALKAFDNVTVVKALRVQKPKFAPGASYNADAVVSSDVARQIREAGKACRLVYLYK